MSISKKFKLEISDSVTKIIREIIDATEKDELTSEQIKILIKKLLKTYSIVLTDKELEDLLSVFDN